MSQMVFIGRPRARRVSAQAIFALAPPPSLPSESPLPVSFYRAGAAVHESVAAPLPVPPPAPPIRPLPRRSMHRCALTLPGFDVHQEFDNVLMNGERHDQGN